MLRRLLLATVLAVGATGATVLPAVPAQARACTIDHYCYTTWYSDSARTIVVGELYESCSGARTMYGTRSAYIRFTETPC